MSIARCERCKDKPASGLYELTVRGRFNVLENVRMSLCGACGLNACSHTKFRVFRDRKGREHACVTRPVVKAKLMHTIHWLPSATL